jgi:hypothetical protein
LGRRLLGNAVAFYFLSSYFILTMRYDGLYPAKDLSLEQGNESSPRCAG